MSLEKCIAETRATIDALFQEQQTLVIKQPLLDEALLQSFDQSNEIMKEVQYKQKAEGALNKSNKFAQKEVQNKNVELLHKLKRCEVFVNKQVRYASVTPFENAKALNVNLQKQITRLSCSEE